MASRVSRGYETTGGDRKNGLDLGKTLLEMLTQLVLVAVFKTVGPHGNHVVGGFDSHAFPPFVELSTTLNFQRLRVCASCFITARSFDPVSFRRAIRKPSVAGTEAVLSRVDEYRRPL